MYNIYTLFSFIIAKVCGCVGETVAKLLLIAQSRLIYTSMGICNSSFPNGLGGKVEEWDRGTSASLPVSPGHQILTQC